VNRCALKKPRVYVTMQFVPGRTPRREVTCRYYCTSDDCPVWEPPYRAVHRRGPANCPWCTFATTAPTSNRKCPTCRCSNAVALDSAERVCTMWPERRESTCSKQEEHPESVDLRQGKSGQDPESGWLSKFNGNFVVQRYIYEDPIRFSRDTSQIVGKKPYLAMLKIPLKIPGCGCGRSKIKHFFLVRRYI